jgi:hypothetical protein
MRSTEVDLSSAPEETRAPVVFPALDQVWLGPKPRPLADDENLDVQAQRLIDTWLGRGEDPEVEVLRLIAVAALRRDWESHRLLQRLAGDEWWPNDRAGRAFAGMMAGYVEELLEQENAHFASESFVKEIEILERDGRGNPSRIRETTYREQT